MQTLMNYFLTSRSQSLDDMIVDCNNCFDQTYYLTWWIAVR